VAAAQAPLTAAKNVVSADQTLINQDQAKLTADQAIMTTDCTADPSSTACTSDTATVNGDTSKLAIDQVTLAKDQATLTSAQGAFDAASAKAKQSNDQAAAQLATASQQLASARSSLAALSGSTSPSTIQGDQAQIAIAQVNVSNVQHQLDGATLASPLAGIVEQVNIQTGQSVSGGGTSGATSSAVVVFTPGSYVLTGTVSDSQVNLVAIGQTVAVTPAGSTQAVLGKITAIAPAATVSSGVATFGVSAQLTTTDNSIKPGMSATASIVVNQVVHVLTVPTSAVHTTAAGSTVDVLVNGLPKTVSVQTGASDPSRVQIVSGLQANQQVVIAVVTSSVPSTGNGTAIGTGGGNRGGAGGRGATGG
jgi:multidrug efflux pump subunit AcrA (membrane-fusion protein)